MRTGASDVSSRGFRGQIRPDSRLKQTRKMRLRRAFLETEFLEPRTLLATIPAATATAAPVNLSGLGTVTGNGNANSPLVVVDPYDSQKVFAVWGVDLSTLSPVPHTTAVVEGAYSADGGTTWTGINLAAPQLDPLTINSSPPTAYTQVTDPSVAFDGQGNVYVLSLQTSGAADGELYLNKLNFSGSAPSLTSSYTIYQWVSGSDAATSPALGVDASLTNPPAGVPVDPHANNVYIAWASIDTLPAIGPQNWNPNRAELVVGTPIANPSGNEQSLAFSPVTTVNADGNYGSQRESHPQLVINQNQSGQITVAWDDFGSGSTASPPFDILDSNLLHAGNSYGFDGSTGVIQPGLPTATSGVTQPVTTTFTDPVNVPSPGAVNNLSVAVDLVDQAIVSNLSLTLVAPNGAQITLVENQIDAAAKVHAGQGLPGGNAIGQFGFTTGATGTPGIQVGTTFDDNAGRNIFDATAAGANGNSATDYIGYFRPEGGSLKSFLASVGAGFINGTWKLEITNYASSTSAPPFGFLNEFNLQFSTGMTFSNGSLNPTQPAEIDTTLVRGALGNTFPGSVPSSPTGVGPGMVVAIDNTLGPDSPYQGRIYAAYVVYFNDTDPNNHTNPTSNTDIALSYSDNGGKSWTYDGLVNSDAATTDGYSGSSIDSSVSNYTSGRTQFQPAIAVDQSTGTLVVSWRDARDDAANARVATYITTSIDGGNSFSAQTYANPQNTAVDAITNQTDVLGPEADNQAGGNGQRDATYGYGDQMGLAVLDGQVFPVWAGNFNQSYLNNGAVTADPLNIWYRPMVIAAGPRIINSSMGPIPLSEATSGSVSISVTFDRPVDPTTFALADVQVFFHNTTYGTASVPLTVTGVTPVAGTGSASSGYTQFTVTFNPLPSGANPATYNYTGTYSYLIAPDNGSGTVISSPVWSYANGVLRQGDPMDQNADGTPDQNALTGPFTGTTPPGLGTPGDVYAVPTPQLPPTTQATTFQGYLFAGYTTVYDVSSFSGLSIGQGVTGPGIPTGTTIVGISTLEDTITLSANATDTGYFNISTTVPGTTYNGAASILQPPYGFNQNTLPLIVPGPQVLATSVPSGDSANGNLVTDGTVSSLNLTFDRPMQTSSFGPGQVLQIMGPTGSISGPQYFPSNSTGQIIPAATASAPGVVDSTLTIPSFGGTFTVADITVQLSAAFSTDSGLTAVLIAPNGTQIQLFSGVGGNGSNFVNTVFDDAAENSITTGKAPFTGTFKPTGQLSKLIGATVDMQNTLKQWVPGTWTLQLTNTLTSASGMLDNWSLNITPQISVTPVSPVNGTATQFTIGFPQQQLSGTYTIQLAPTIEDTFGDQLDTNQNAGLAVLRDQNQNSPTTTVHYTSSDLPKAIPAPAGKTAGQVTSTITVPDNFLIEGDKTAAGASVMQVQLSLTYPTDPDLTATLTHYSPAGANLGQVTLFSGVGAGPNKANFNSTVFDDNAATPIQFGGAPFFSTFNPQQSLATVFAPAPNGTSVQGTWVLTIQNNSTTGGTGTITNWSLTFQKPLPTSGLGEPGSDDYSTSFRIFTLAQSDALSSEAWTAVGPASIGGGSSNPGGDPSGRVTGLAIDPSDPSGNTVYAAGASGGIWKTTDFLTTSVAGPTWIPLTDFGPTSGVNIGGDRGLPAQWRPQPVDHHRRNR